MGNTVKVRVAANAGLIGAAFLAAGALPAEATDISFTLDWQFQGPTSFLLMANDRGYYSDAGLNVSIDSGQGSAGAVNRVASGAYDMAFADINALIEYNVNNPDDQIKAIMVVYDFPPFGIYTLAGNGIETPEDLVGRTLGAPVFDASYKLFPAFADAVGIDPDDVSSNNMDPSLREAMLIQGEVDAIAGHYFSSTLDLRARGADPDDIIAMRYSDFGLDFYGNVIIASNDMVETEGEALSAFLSATTRALKEMIEDPEAALQYTLAADPLVDPELELERLNLAIDTNIVTPHSRENGLGDVDYERLARSIDQLELALDLEFKPDAEDIFTREFLPPQEERMLP